MLFNDYGSAEPGAVLVISQPEHAFVSGQIGNHARTMLHRRLVW